MGVGGKLSESRSPLVGEEFAQELGRRIAEISAHVHAAMAEIVSLASEFDSLEGWMGQGYRSFAQWLSVNCGFDAWMGLEIFRVGQDLRSLPLIRSAFQEGRLSFDKVRSVTRVACADEDEMWLGIARMHRASSWLGFVVRSGAHWRSTLPATRRSNTCFAACARSG